MAYDPTYQHTPILWDGVTTPVSEYSGSGYFNNDPDFQLHAPRFATWAGNMLGYPVIDVELNSTLLYTAFDTAIQEYSAQVQQFTIRENMFNLIGTDNDKTSINYVDFSSRPTPVSIDRALRIAEEYGQEAGVGGNITWKQFSIPITQSVQKYNLNELMKEALATDRAIEVRRVHHYQPAVFGYGLSAMSQYGLPNSTMTLLGEFGWDSMIYGGAATGLSYTLMPIYEDLLRMQAVELNMQVRRSGYGFELINNQLKIFPVPMANFTLWIDYIFTDERLSSGNNAYSGSVTTNLGDAPYTFMQYSKINDPGRRWIFKYGLAVAKEMLGGIRAKYSTIPTPNGEVTLDGDSLKQEAQTEKDTLVTQLREDLERTSTQNQMMIQAEIADNVSKQISKVPRPFFIF